MASSGFVSVEPPSGLVRAGARRAISAWWMAAHGWHERAGHGRPGWSGPSRVRVLRRPGGRRRTGEQQGTQPSACAVAAVAISCGRRAGRAALPGRRRRVAPAPAVSRRSAARTARWASMGGSDSPLPAALPAAGPSTRSPAAAAAQRPREPDTVAAAASMQTATRGLGSRRSPAASSCANLALSLRDPYYRDRLAAGSAISLPHDRRGGCRFDEWLHHLGQHGHAARSLPGLGPTSHRRCSHRWHIAGRSRQPADSLLIRRTGGPGRAGEPGTGQMKGTRIAARSLASHLASRSRSWRQSTQKCCNDTHKSVECCCSHAY